MEVPITLEDLEENLKSISIEEQLQDSEELEIQVPTVDDMVWLAFPRAGSTFGARFELPIDLRKLKSIIINSLSVDQIIY